MNVHPDLKRFVVARAQGKTLNEVVTELLCQALGLDVKDYPVPRRAPGRKASGADRKLKPRKRRPKT